MQPFDGIDIPPNVQPQAQPLDPKPQEDYQFDPSAFQPDTESYQPPLPLQQQPGGYPMPQDQFISMAKSQGAQQAKNSLHRQLLAQELGKNIKANGKGLVALFSIFMTTITIGGSFVYGNQTKYSQTSTAYHSFVEGDYNIMDTLSQNSCQAFLAAILGVPYCLLGFGIFHIVTMWISFTGLTCCRFFHALLTVFWAVIAAWTSQQKCVGYSIISTTFGQDTPQNAWIYYAGMALASFTACVLNFNWRIDKDRAERDQRNLAFIMASS